MWWSHRVRRALSEPFALPLHTSGADFLGMLCGVSIRQIKVYLGMYDPLTRLAARYKSDKGVTIFPFHGYSVHYAELFKSIRQRRIKILEIGLARREDRDSLGPACPSLNMWLDYFPHAQVLGLDIDDFSWANLPRTQIFRGDQGNAQDLLKVVTQYPSLDIVIDDGSHASYHQQISLKTLFPYLASGGLYVIEDLLCQPEELAASLPAVCKTSDLLKNRAALDLMISGVAEMLFFESKGLAVIIKA